MNTSTVSTAAVRCVGLRRAFGAGNERIEALRGADLEIQHGEYVALRGPSGSGKSTLLHCVGALDRGYTGELSVLGVTPRTLGDRELSRFRGQRVGFVFQHYHLLPHLTVLENILVPALLCGVAEAREAWARQLLSRVGLAARASARPGELSGGPQQRVALARALVLDAPLLVCDEPTGSLDSVTGDSIMDLLEQVRAERNATLIVVTHEPRIAQRADRVIELRDGQVVSEGGPA